MGYVVRGAGGPSLGIFFLTIGVNGLTLYVVEISLLIYRFVEHEMTLQV